MKAKVIFIGICLCLLVSLCGCTYKSNKKISQDDLDSRKENYERYLKKTYPDEDFKVEVWQEYAKSGGAGGLPDYEGYQFRSVITDSNGNRFKIHGDSPESYYDDRKKVLDGWINYDENGELILTDK